jgi:hypothetical protein
VITNQLVRLSRPSGKAWTGLGFAALEALVVFGLGRQTGFWWLAALAVAVIELRALRPEGRLEAGKRTAVIWERLPGLVMGLSVTLIIVLVPRLATQAVVAVLYAAWLLWREREPKEVSTGLVHLLLVQGVMFEAIFLMAAIWQVPSWLVLALVWIGAYAGVYGTLRRREDRSAGVMAATWGVIATEVAWILQLWLITYTMRGGYVLVPQPALILTALTYVFGSILASSRQGNLSRARLGEYMVIALILVVIVVIGTSWRGNV